MLLKGLKTHRSRSLDDGTATGRQSIVMATSKQTDRKESQLMQQREWIERCSISVDCVFENNRGDLKNPLDPEQSLGESIFTVTC
jgi:hypothetical protein